MFILGVEVVNSFEIEEVLFSEIVTWEDEEPIAFSLFREAELIINENPRAGYVVLVQSLEIATKQFLMNTGKAQYHEIFTDQNLTSIESLLIKDLFEGCLGLIFTEETSELIKQIFQERNTLVHQGTFIHRKKAATDPFDPITSILKKIR